MLKLFISTSVFLALPAIAFAHPHSVNPETPPAPDSPPKVVIKKMIQQGDEAMTETDGKRVIMRRMVIDKEADTDASWIDDEHHKFVFKLGGDGKSEIIDLGDKMSAKIDGDNVIILRGDTVLGATPPDGETVNVEKDVRIENGRKKTRIVIELDAPAQ